jgi:hypothetical protein
LGGFLSSLRDICLFRSGPEDMPHAPQLLVALLAACGAVEAAFDLHGGARPGMIAAALLGGLAMVGTLFVLLRGRGKPERFVQTATALAAVKLLFDLAVYPLALLLPLKEMLARFDAAALTGSQTLVMVAIAALGVWELCVWIGVLRRSLDIPLAGAVLVFLLLFFVNSIVLGIGAGLAGAS